MDKGHKAAPKVKMSSFTLIIALLLGIFALFAIPELIDRLLTFGGLQLRYALVILFFVTVACVVSVRRIAIQSRLYLWIVILQILLMTAVGILQRGQVIFEWRLLGYDLIVLGGYLCGMLLTLDQPAWRIMKVIRLAYLVWLVGLLLDSLLLTFGLIPPVWLGDPRVHVWAEFTCIEGLLLALPYLLHPSMQRGAWLLRGRFLGLVGVVAVLIVNNSMGARSVLVQVFSAFLLCLPLYFKRLPRTLLYTGVVLLSIGLGIFVQSSSSLSKFNAVQRLQQTDISGEERTEELHSLLGYIGWYGVFGLGNGSGFPSPTENEGENFAAYPHLAIFTPLQKGGIPATLVLVVSPLVMLFMVLFRHQASPLQQEAATSALLFLLYSSVSGGWVFPNWIFFGIAAGYCFYGKSGLALDFEGDARIIEANL